MVDTPFSSLNTGQSYLSQLTGLLGSKAGNAVTNGVANAGGSTTDKGSAEAKMQQLMNDQMQFSTDQMEMYTKKGYNDAKNSFGKACADSLKLT